MRPPPSTSRRENLGLAALAAAGLAFAPSEPVLAGSRLPQNVQPPAVVLKLTRCGAALCTEYAVEGQRFRAVVDTGSPFLLVASGPFCNKRDAARWGCFSQAGAGDSIDMQDSSREGFGGQIFGVQWRRGEVALGGLSAPASRTRPNPSALTYSPVNFGVVLDSVGLAGTQAIYLGLVKERQARIRPTFLEQTDIKAMRFDFVDNELTLARRPLIGSDAVPLVDLRELGAPVAQYGCRVERLVVNGKPVELQRPCIAILDTGTTGLVISDSLYDSDELPLPGAAIREVEVETRTERGRAVSFFASRRRQRDKGDDEYPLICTSEHLEWFESDAAAMERSAQAKARRQSEARLEQSEAAGGGGGGGGGGAAGGGGGGRRRALLSSSVSEEERKPHVLFLGLAFLDGMQLTIDLDERRMLAATRRA